MGWKRLQSDVFAIDPRALAAVRIGLGCALLVDLWQRSAFLAQLYTDDGVLPRSLLPPELKETFVPFHLLSGGIELQAALFGIAALAALAMLLGLHTRVATVISWALLTSLHVRNPMILNWGDEIFRAALFWCMFLPLGRVASLDARRARRAGAASPPHGPLRSLPGAAFLIQIAFVYFFTALLKSGPDWREDGLALHYALNQDYYVTALGTQLRAYPTFLWLVTRATLLLEFVGPFLLLAPVGWVRTLAVGSFLALHLGIAASYHLGVFPWIDMVILLAFLPPPVWDALGRIPGLAALRAGDPDGAAPTAREADTSAGALRIARDVLVAVLLAYVFVVNLNGVGARLTLPGWVDDVGYRLRLEQKWRMFTPNAPRSDGWFVLPGRLATGERIDLSPRGPALTWERPERYSTSDDSLRWAIFMWQMRKPTSNAILRRRLGAWLCEQWNATHDPRRRLESVGIWFVSERTLPPPEPPQLERRKLWSRACPGAGGPPA